ncbi:hypothetical protein [uncultured Algimonas sp.]|uniref:hypothetical protein n=1 Tax=uncultured Algimonas sp. TaxID=1547920 RepID=UPI00261C0C78|nr:hypothetical protein [uncultured Algimonas sp.]
MRKVLAWCIGALFILYGLIRFGGSAMIFHALTTGVESGFQDGIDKIAALVDRTADIQIVPFTVAGYFAYVALLGASQIAGTLGTMFRRRWGVWVMGVYFLIFGLGFVNFQLFNMKTGVLFVSLALYGLMLWLLRLSPTGRRRDEPVVAT